MLYLLCCTSSNFLPGSGTLQHVRLPALTDSVRVDTGVVQGDEVSIFYDPMIAKLIVHGEDRSTALDALIRALHEYQIVGLPTNIEFVSRTAAHPEFRRGGVDTSFLNKYGDELLAPLGPFPKPVRALAAVSLLALEQQRLASLVPPVPASLASFRTLDTPERVITLRHELGETAVRVASLSNDTFEVSLNEEGEDGELSAAETFIATGAVDSKGNFEYHVGARKFKGTAVVHGHNLHVFCDDGSERYDYVFDVPAPSVAGSESANSGAGEVNKKVVTPMPGKIIKVLVKPGDEVTNDQPLLIMEAMKMEHVLRATRDGKVGEVWCAEGDFVGDSQVLIELG